MNLIVIDTNIFISALIKKGAAREIITKLKSISKPVKTNKEIFQIASVSADSEYYGKIIAETLITVPSPLNSSENLLCNR